MICIRVLKMGFCNLMSCIIWVTQEHHLNHVSFSISWLCSVLHDSKLLSISHNINVQYVCARILWLHFNVGISCYVQTRFSFIYFLGHSFRDVKFEQAKRLSSVHTIPLPCKQRQRKKVIKKWKKWLQSSNIWCGTTYMLS
jgi:hypothetical protein